MSIAIIAILIIGVLGLGFALARRAIRLVVRLALAAIFILVVLVAGLAAWWYMSAGSSHSTQKEAQRAAPRRATPHAERR